MMVGLDRDRIVAASGNTLTVELVVLGLVVVVVTACAVLGAMAFFNMGRYRNALAEAAIRIQTLEKAVVTGEPVEVNGALVTPAQPAAAKAAPRSAQTTMPSSRPAAEPHREDSPPPVVHPEPSRPLPTPQQEAPQHAAPVPAAAPEPAPEPLAAQVGPLLPDPIASEPVMFRAPPPNAPPPEPPIALASTEEPPLPPKPRTAVALPTSTVAWAAGAGVAIAVVAFLRYAHLNGFFDRASLLAFGWLLGGGLVVGAEFLRGRQPLNVAPHEWAIIQAPRVLAAAGVVCLYGMAWVGYAQLGLLNQTACIAMLGAFSLAALGLSLSYGPSLAWLGLLGGVAAPLTVGVDNATPAALFSYLFAVTSAGFALAERRDWKLLAAASATAAIAWALYWTLQYLSSSGAMAASVFLVVVAALGVAYAGPELADPLLDNGRPLRPPWRARGWIGVCTILASAAVLVTLFWIGHGRAPSATLALAAMSLMLAMAAGPREGFAPLAVLVAALGLGTLAGWPPFLDRAGLQNFATAAGAVGFAASVGGWLMIGRNKSALLGSVLAAVAPSLALLAAQTRLGAAVAPAPYWAVAALAFAVLNGLALYRLGKALDRASGPVPGAVNVFGIGASICAVMAGAFAFDLVHLGGAVALLVPALAFLDKKLSLTGLRALVIVVATLSVVLLSPPALVFADIDPTPVFNTMTLAFAVAIAAFAVAEFLLRSGPSGVAGHASRVVAIGFIALIFCAGWAEIRHVANAGRMDAPYRSLWEAGGHTAFFAAVAAGLVAIQYWPRFAGPASTMRRRTEIFAIGGALTHAAMVQLVFLNPWWGLLPSEAGGQTLILSFFVPGLLFVGYGVLKREDGAGAARRAAFAGAFVLLLVGVLLEARSAFHPSSMDTGAILPAEHAAYTGVLLAAAAVVWAIARWRNVPQLRYVSAALAIVGFTKAMLVDGMLSEGLLARVGVYAFILAAAAGAAYAYLRWVFPTTGQAVVALARRQLAALAAPSQPPQT